MKPLRNIWHSLAEDESAQGATEYILLLVVIVGISLIFKDRITTIVKGKLDEIATLIEQFKSAS
jgi:hypothetical protein